MLGREDPPAVLELDVPRLDGQEFARPGLSLSCRDQQVPESRLLHDAEDRLVLRLGDDDVPGLRLRLVRSVDGQALDEPFLGRPAERVLDAPGEAVLGRRAPFVVRVDNLGDVIGTEPRDRKVFR